MRLRAVDQAIGACSAHLSSVDHVDPEIKSFLTQYLAVLITSEFEQAIERMIVETVRRAGSDVVALFAESCVSAVFRSTMTSEIAGLLNRFGSQYKAMFIERMKSNARGATLFNNIVLARHETAHRSGSVLTFDDLCVAYEEGHVVLDVVAEVLATIGAGSVS